MKTNLGLLMLFTFGWLAILFALGNKEFASNYAGTDSTYLSIKYKEPIMCSSPTAESMLLAMQPIANGLWTDNTIWPNGIKPTANDIVVVPTGRTLTMVGTCLAKSITVNGTLNAVNWQSGGAWINLETEGIMINSGGKLEIGTEAQPYNATEKCIITLKGDKIDNAPSSLKGILVMEGGTLELHGKKRKSWTNISATANAGATTINLKEAVDWEIGDIIALTSTELANAQNKTWERVDQVEILSISTDRKTITLKSPLLYKHIGGSKTYTRPTDGKTWSVNIQGEVGLLSHYIKIQGKMDGTNETNGFGGHMMSMKGSTVHVEQVELYKMGQKGITGRYPFHWHLCENTAIGSYFRNSSVHKSFNRAVTIHGTDYVTVDGIFAYDHIGHGIFLEDGGERFNTIKNNVVFVTRRPKEGEQVTLSDNEANEAQNRTPSSYWITNPNNYFENNVAAGTEGTGFWIALPNDGKPLGQSTGKPMAASGQLPYFAGVNPVKENLGLFKGFVAHTCMNGWDVFDQLNPNHSLQKNIGWNITSEQYIENGLFYGNETALYCGLGVNGDATKVVFRNCAFSDNQITTMLAADLTLENCLFNGDSDLEVFTGNREFFRFYDGPGRHFNCHFENWNRTYTYMIRQEGGGGATENFNPSFRGITKGFTEPFNFRFAPLSTSSRTRTIGQFFKDYDGGLTGKAHTTIVRDIPFLTDGHEYRHSSWRNAARSNYYFASLWFANINDTATQISTVRTKSGTPDACFFESGTPSSGTYKFPLIVNEGFLYNYYFSKAPETNNIHMIWTRGDIGDLGFICLKGLGKLSGLRFENAGSTVIQQLSSRTAIQNATNTSYFIDTNGDVYVKFRSVGQDAREQFFLKWNSIGTFSPSPLPCTTNNLEGLTAKDTDGDGQSDLDETDVCRLVNDAGDLNFEFNKRDEGFERFNTAAENTSNETYWLIRADKSSDPYIVKSGLKFKGSEVPQLKIRMRSEAAGSFQLFWTTTNQPDFVASNSVTVAPNQTNVDQELVFNMSGMNTWMGQTITKIRIDFPPDVNANRHTFLDYIHGPKATLERICNKPPQLSFTSPTQNQYDEGASLGVVVNAIDSDGTIANVQLFLNNVFIRQEGVAPYEWGTANAGQNDGALLNLVAGTYTFKAIATDNAGATSEVTKQITIVKKTKVVQINKRNVPYAIDGNNGGADNQNVYIWSSNASNVNQQWIEIDRGNGYYSYQKINTTYCIDGGNGGTNNQNVYLWTCGDDNQNQHWKKIDLGSGYFRLEKRNAPGYTLDGGAGGANGQNLKLFSFNNTNVNQHWSFTTVNSGTISSRLEEETFSVYPNPVTDVFTFDVKASAFGTKSIGKIYDNSGLVVRSFEIDASNPSISLAELKAGIYLLYIEGKNRIYSTKIIKQ